MRAQRRRPAAEHAVWHALEPRAQVPRPIRLLGRAEKHLELEIVPGRDHGNLLDAKLRERIALRKRGAQFALDLHRQHF